MLLLNCSVLQDQESEEWITRKNPRIPVFLTRLIRPMSVLTASSGKPAALVRMVPIAAEEFESLANWWAGWESNPGFTASDAGVLFATLPSVLELAPGVRHRFLCWDGSHNGRRCAGGEWVH